MELSAEALSNSPAPKRRLLWMQSKVGSPILMVVESLQRSSKKKEDNRSRFLLSSNNRLGPEKRFVLMRWYDGTELVNTDETRRVKLKKDRS